MQVKGMMELGGKRSDVFPEFWSGKNSQTISVHAVANQLAPRKCLIRSIHARAIIGRKRGLAGIGTKLVGVKLLNTLQQVSKLTSTN